MLDSTFTDAHRLHSLAIKLRASDKLFLGDEKNHCNVESGMILSRTLLQDWFTSIKDQCTGLMRNSHNWMSRCMEETMTGIHYSHHPHQTSHRGDLTVIRNNDNATISL